MAAPDQATAAPVRYLYKILPSAPPEPLPPAYPPSELDRADGFVHLSTAAQVPLTADRFFADAAELWLVRLELAALADPVRWEAGFPHLYGSFGARHVESVRRLERAHDEAWPAAMEACTWLE